MEFGMRLRELLHDKNISQKDFAIEMGIAPSTAGNYVNGLREPDYESLKRIARYFHVSIDFLLDYHGDREGDERDYKLLQIFHALTEEQKEFYIEQGKLFIKSNYKKKVKSSSRSGSDDKAGYGS